MGDLQDASDKSWRVARQRKVRARTRLSYMLLDIFIGGFVVGIVLMTTLGRPDQTNAARGAGGEPFLAIDVYWEDSDVILAPVVQFEDGAGKLKGLGVYGLAAIWGDENGVPGLWPGYVVRTGRLDLETQLATSTQLDGFDPRHDRVRMTRDRKVGSDVRSMNFGQILISEPCTGNWRVGVRVIETPANIDPAKAINVWIDVTTGGFGDANGNTTISEAAALSVQQGGNVFAAMKNKDNRSYISVSLASNKEEAPARCVIK